MKAFLISISVFLVMCSIVIWNSIYISNITDELTQLTEKITNVSNFDQFKTLEDYWDKHKLILSISIPHDETDEMEKQLLLLKTKFESNSLSLQETKTLVLKAIEEIRVHGTLNIDNVF